MTQNIKLANLTVSQGFIISGAKAGDSNGYSVSGAGDFNGDGYDDLIIGAPNSDSNDGADAGISYVIFGKEGSSNIDLSSLSLMQGFSIVGQYDVDYIGYSVSGAGDINGDGYDDLIIGAPGEDHNGGGSGTSYVIFGKGSSSNIDLSYLTLSQGFAIYGADPNDYSAKSVSGAGDVNGDGYDDLIIGAPDADQEYAGSSYVVFGKSDSFSNIGLEDLSSYEGFSIAGDAANDHSGYSVSRAGDINGDGYGDIIIGAPYADPDGRIDAGTTYVIFGKEGGFSNIALSSLSLIQGFSILGASDGDQSGYSVGCAGDFNKDGYDDIIIGSPSAGINAIINAGISYIIFGKPGSFSDIDLVSITTTQGFRVTGALSNGYSGYSVSGAGDFNGDGYDDLIIGAPGISYFAGISYVIYGGSTNSDIDLLDISSAQGFTITGANAGDYSGWSVSGGGDINGDGIQDLIIGAQSASSIGKIDAGDGYVIYGISSDDTQSLAEDNIGLIVGTVVGATALLGIAGYAFYAYTHSSWPFSSDEPLAKMSEMA